MTDTNHRRETIREHVRVCFPEVPGARTYALDDPALDSLAVLASCWQLEREAHDVGFSRDDLTAFLTGLSRHLPQLVQQKPAAADAPAATAPPRRDVLNDAQQRALRQIEDLTRLAALKRLGAGQVSLAALAALRPMLDPLVRG